MSRCQIAVTIAALLTSSTKAAASTPAALVRARWECLRQPVRVALTIPAPSENAAPAAQLAKTAMARFMTMVGDVRRTRAGAESRNQPP